jgi:hypothetical protein
MTATALAYQQQAAIAQQQQAQQALTQSLQSISQQIQQQTQQIQQQSQQFVAPQVTPIPPPGGYQTRCLTNGVWVNCRSNF